MVLNFGYQLLTYLIKQIKSRLSLEKLFHFFPFSIPFHQRSLHASTINHLGLFILLTWTTKVMILLFLSFFFLQALFFDKFFVTWDVHTICNFSTNLITNLKLCEVLIIFKTLRRCLNSSAKWNTAQLNYITSIDYITSHSNTLYMYTHLCYLIYVYKTYILFSKLLLLCPFFFLSTC